MNFWTIIKINNTISPNVDANFSTLDINAYFRILFAKFESLKTTFKGSFVRTNVQIQPNQVHLGPNFNQKAHPMYNKCFNKQ